MQIAVTPPHQPGALTQKQQRLHALECFTRFCGEGTQVLQRKQIRFRCELGLVLRDNVGKCFDEMRVRCCRHHPMRRRHGAPEFIGQRFVNFADLSQMVEGLALVETTHLDDPFDRLAFSVNHEPAICLACYRVRAAVNRRGVSAIDCDLGFTRGPPAPKGGKIEERKAHRALDLERPLAGQKNRGGVGVDTLDRRATMGGRIAQEVDHRLLYVIAHAAAF